MTAPTSPSLRPFALGEPKGARTHRVVEGEVALFLSGGDGDQAHARHYLASLRSGEILFDLGWEALPPQLHLLAEALPGTEIEPIEADTLAPSELAAALDRWMLTLLGAILHLGEEEAAFTHPTEPGQSIPDLNAGEVLGLRSGVGWWEPGQHALRYLETDPPTGVALPLIPRLGVEITGPTPASTLLTTETFLARSDRWERLARTHRALGHALRQALRHLETEAHQIAQERLALSTAAHEQGWLELADVMADRALPIGGAAAGGEPRSIEVAFRRVAQHLGVELKASSHPLESTDPMEKVAELARQSGLRWRQVVLQGDWHRQDQGPLIAFIGGSEEAVALLPQGRRRYRLLRADGRSEPLTAARAEQLSPQAAMLYRTLPTHRLALRHIVQFAVKGSLPDFSLVLALVIITGLLGLATPALSARIYDVIIPQSEHSLMLQIVLILGVAAMTQAFFELARAITLMRIENRANSPLHAAVWDRLLKLPSRFFRRFTSGDLATRVQGVTDAHQILASTGVTLLFTLPTGLFNLVVMFWHSHTLALWGLGIALAGAFLSVALSFAEILILRRQFEVHGKLSGMVIQIINGVGKLRLANAEHFAFAAWARQYATQERLAMKAGRWGVLSQTFFSGFSLLVTGVIFGLVGWQLSQPGANAAMTTGAFLAFNAAFGALIGSLVTVAQQSLNLLQLFPLLERTRPIFEAEPEAALTRVHPGPLQGEIEINNLTFSYRSDTPPVLDRFSLKVRPGEFVALVGPSGCGKSTLLRLLLGFETPDSGTLFYDGKDLQTLDLQELRRQIGVVLQSTQLFAGDVFRNIVGESNLTLSDAWDAAEMAGLADDIRRMPMQMHTVVSEGGTGFSGGQKQRLAIARAFAHKPRLLFFDEATSALDNRTQAIVTESMERLQVTRIVVAHRLSTILHAQRIIVLDNGRIGEEGTYTSLMARRGLFYELARHQRA